MFKIFAKMKIIFVLFFMMINVVLNATTYYISPAGNDTTGTGASGNPWRSLYKECNSVATAGDIIHINAGTYIETNKCTLANGVSIEGDGVSSIIKSHYVAGKSNWNIALIMIMNTTIPNPILNFLAMVNFI